MNASSRHDALLVFMPSGKRGRFPLGTPILQAARNLGVDIDSVCGGRGICGRCQIEVSEGEFAKLGVTSKLDHLTPFGKVDRGSTTLSTRTLTSKASTVLRSCARIALMLLSKG